MIPHQSSEEVRGEQIEYMTDELVWSPHQSTLPPSGSTSSFEASNLHKARYRIGLSHGGINQVGHAIAMQWVNEVAPAITSTGRDFQLVPHKEGSNYQCSRFHTPMLPEEWDKLMHKNEQSTNGSGCYVEFVVETDYSIYLLRTENTTGGID